MSRYVDINDVFRALVESHCAMPNIKKMQEVFDSVPTASVVLAVHGKWIKLNKRGKNVQCSLCGNTLDLRGVNTGRGDANYCPNCGAKMGGEK